MHSCIFRAPVSFFDKTPSGRIITRCSADQNAVDVRIGYQVWAVAFTTTNLLGTIAALMSQVAWQILIVFLPLISASFWYQLLKMERTGVWVEGSWSVSDAYCSRKARSQLSTKL